jgi:hypothetical protein
MIPAEARNILDTISSIKHSRDTILDAMECLSRMSSPSDRDRNRVLKATKAIEQE